MSKPSLSSLTWTAIGAAVLAWMVSTNPPAGASWRLFADEPTDPWLKVEYLAGIYLVPAVFAMAGIIAFQLQFRVSMSGARPGTVFGIGVLGASAMLGGFRLLALAPNSLPGYVLGMAAGYTVMSRLYAIRMRRIWGRLRVPWVVWRGDRDQVREIDRLAAVRFSDRTRAQAQARAQEGNVGF
jgi:hypothetical protein